MSVGGFTEHILAGKWIAGEHIEDVIRVSRDLNSHKAASIINYLGESLHEQSDIDKTMKTYFGVIGEIKKNRIRADIAIKPTQLGLVVNKKLFRANSEKIINYAHANGIFVWFDMEEYNFVDNEISAYMNSSRDNVGICIQSYLKQSFEDVKRIVKIGGTIRLVKGAYSEPGKGFDTREETTANYIKIMNYLFEHSKRFTIGTHDTAVIEKALKLNKKYKRDVTYAMLKGIRNNYAFELAKNGEKVSIYVPFGERWISYSYRRLKELSNLKLIVRSLFGN
jgi:proline dehydrogenase